MKKAIIAVGLLLFMQTTRAQILNPVKWAYAAKKLNDKEVMLLLKATIDKGWHIYSLHVKDNGPAKTEIIFYPSKSYILVGKLEEPKGITKYDKEYKMEISYFENEVIFRQKIKLQSGNRTVIKGKLTYETCNDRKCLPPEDQEFAIPVN